METVTIEFNDVEMPRLRRPDGLSPKYTNREHFSIRIHYNGKIEGDEYIGGKIIFSDYHKIEYFSMFYLQDDAKRLNLNPNYMRYHFKDRELGFVEIDSDTIAYQCVNRRNETGVVVVYFSQENAPVNAILPPDHVNLDEVSLKVADDALNENEKNGEDNSSVEDFDDEDYIQSDEEPNDFDDFEFNRAVGNDKEDDLNDQHEGEKDSDYANSEDMHSIDSSSSDEEGIEGDVGSKKARCMVPPKTRQWRRDVDLEDPKIEIGLSFPNISECKEAVRELAVKSGKPLWFHTMDARRVRVKCKGTAERTCPFLIFASIVNDGPTVQVKRFKNTHICGRSTKIRFCSSTWIAKRFEEDVRLNPQIKVSQLRSIVRKKFSVDMSRHQIYKAKLKALRTIQGTYEAQYALLDEYGHELLKRNPGSTVIIKSTLEGNDRIFQRMYVCFSALKNGFLDGCRKIFGVDGCHLKGPYPGQLLTAVGIDANNGMYPIAYAVVELETKETWKWFFENFIEDIGIGAEGMGWVIMSDKQKGLKFCVEELLPLAVHRFCVGHFHANFKKAGHGGLALKQQLWSIARTTTIPYFNREMDKMNGLSHEAYSWLVDHPPEKWSRAYFEVHTKCDMLLNNLCEAFNKSILDARDKPILVMLENIRMYLMLRMAKQRDVVWNQCVGPRIEKIVEKSKEVASNCTAQYSGEQTFQVNHVDNGTKFLVDLKNKTCSCRKWDLTGIPCCHGIAALSWSKTNPLDVVSEWYKREKYDISYKGYISPMSDSELWPKTGNTPIKPPYVKIQPGRKKTKRRKGVEELNNDEEKLKKFNTIITCTHCKGKGHNRRTCPKIPPEEKKARAREVAAKKAKIIGETSTSVEPPARRLTKRASNETCTSRASQRLKKKQPS